MFSISKTVAALIGICVLTSSYSLRAQETGSNSGSDTSSPEASPTDIGTPTGRSPENQVSNLPDVAMRLGQMKAFCTGSGGFVIDCLAERLEALGLDSARMDSHREMKQILRETAKELRQLARANRDPNGPRGRISSADGQRSTRPLIAVVPAKQRSANRQAIAILQEAETKLLRSSSGSASRASQYQQVAQALGSNKVLLRS